MDNSKLNSNHNRYTTNYISGEKDFKFSSTDEENQYKKQLDVLNKRNKTMVPDTYDMPLEKMYTATPGLFGQRHTPDYNNLKNRNSDKYDPVGDYYYQRGDRDHTSITKYTSNYISIDSRLRQKNPKYDTLNYVKLAENPLEVENKSNILTIQINDSIKLEPNDKISLIGLAGETHRFVASFPDKNLFEYDYKDSNKWDYLKINYPSGLNLSNPGEFSNYDNSDLYINLEIENVVNTENTPNNLSFLNGLHKIYLFNDDYGPRSNEYFFIKLQKREYTNINIYPQNIVKITYLYKYGYAINKINSEYPISFENSSGYLVIKSVNNNKITIEMSKYALTDSDSSLKTIKYFGGKNICIAKLNEIVKGDPTPSEYSINLDKIYNNAILIKLISSEFPSLNKLITSCDENNNINIINNSKLYWQNYYEKDIYSIDIESGNYTMEQLIKLIEYKVSLVPRNALDYTFNEIPSSMIPSSCASEPSIYNLIRNTPNIIKIENIKGDNTFIFKSYTQVKLYTKPIEYIKSEINREKIEYIFRVNYPNHNLIDGDIITISGAIDTDGFLSEDLNKSFKVEIDNISSSCEFDIINYFNIRLTCVNRIGDTTITKGGDAIVIVSPNLFRLRFDYHDTLGGFFGFRKLGDSKSITNYGQIISNRDLYQNENLDSNLLCTTFDINNNPIYKVKTIDIKDDDYIYMTCNTLNLPDNKINQMVTFSKIKNVFAKILIKNDYNSIDNKVYNTFIQNPIYMHIPIQDLRELQFKFYDRFGNLINFGDFEHSFTLEVVTIAEVPERTNFSAIYPKVN